MTAMPQHMEALAHANDVRLGIAEFRREVSAHGRTGNADAARKVARAILANGETLGRARVGHLISAIPGIGASQVRKCAVAAGVTSVDRRVQDLTERQRKAVAYQLGFWADTRPRR